MTFMINNATSFNKNINNWNVLYVTIIQNMFCNAMQFYLIKILENVIGKRIIFLTHFNYIDYMK